MKQESKSDNDFLKEIYLNYRQYIYSVAIKYLRDESLAEDIVQDTIIIIREKIIKKEIKSCHKLDSLIGCIVKGLCIDLIRRNQKIAYREIFEDEIKVDDTFVSRLIFNEAINNLPENYREVFILRVIEEMEYKEIANKLDLNESVARKRMERARKLIKEVLVGDDNE